MPKLSIWAIRLSLFYLVAGWGVGALLMANRAWGWSGALWGLLGVHVAFVLFGWTLQLVVAVAYWILPTFGGRTNRGREWAAWSSVAMINLGVVAVVVSLPMIVASLLWLAATMVFGWHAWPRVKTFGR